MKGPEFEMIQDQQEYLLFVGSRRQKIETKVRAVAWILL